MGSVFIFVYNLNTMNITSIITVFYLNTKYGQFKLKYTEKVLSSSIVSGATLIAIPPKMTGGSGFTLRVLVDTDSSYAYKQSGRMSGAGTQNINVCGFLALFYFILYVQ